MSEPTTIPTDRPTTLTELGATLDGRAICAIATAIERARDATRDEAIARHHRVDVPGLTTTPFMHQVALVARERGFFSFNRLERDHLPPAPGWIHPELAPDYFQIRRGGEIFHAPALWPFAQDCPVGDYQLNLAPKWWSHGLVHTMIGFGTWPGLDEWQVMHMARLSEAIAAIHWYWLAELGRAHPLGARVDLSRLDEGDAAVYLRLELDARDPAVRLERLASEHATMIADNATEILNYESFAYRHGMLEGYLVEPTEKYLEFGEACDYAKVHHLRLTSPSFARWVEHCLEAEVDYATSPEGFEARAADVLRAIVSPLEAISADRRRERAVRVLQDLGQRVCHAAALRGAPIDGLAAPLTAIADGIRELRGGAAPDDADGIVAGALEAVASGVEGGTPGAAALLALGYAPTDDPTAEPGGAKNARADAFIARAWRAHPVLGTAAESMRPAARRLVDGVRGPSLVAELRASAGAAAAALEVDYVGEAYAGWLEVAEQYWGRLDGVGNVETRWHYRLARRALPEDESTWDRFVLQLNPYLSRLPLPFDARWNEEFVRQPRGEVRAFRPRPPTSANYALIGAGRRGPVYMPISPKLNGLLTKLKAPRRLDTLAAMREFDRELLERAVREDLILCLQKPAFDMPETSFNLFDHLMDQALAVEQRLEQPGPWDEPEMAAAYEAFCARSDLYLDTSRALVERLVVPPDARVAELGFGTGVTSRVVLERLGPEGRLVAADPAPRMVERVYENINDSRARFILGASRSLAQVALTEGGFDRVVANSSIWLTPDITDELGYLRRSLLDGGVLGFSLNAEYLGHTPHLTSEAGLALAEALGRARERTGLTPPGPEEHPFGLDAALGSVDAMRGALTSQGYDRVSFDLYHRPWAAAEYLDWLSLPVVSRGMCAATERHRALELIEALREELDPETPLETVWYLVTARAA